MSDIETTDTLPAKKPQDHKPPAVKPGTFKAKVGSKTKTFTLPEVTETAALSVDGSTTMDLILRPDDMELQLRAGFQTLLACNPKPEVLAAFRSLPTGEMLEVLGDWMGESSGSSD